MTEKLYWDNAYLKEFEAKVIKIEGNAIYLDRTAFYPTSGGQPNDTGKILANGKEYRIIDVRKQSDEILHICETAPEIKVGDPINGLIDWERRYALMRLHTAIHLLDAVIERDYKSGMITGGQIYVDRARVDVNMEGLTREKVQEVIERCNAVAKEGHDVITKQITREEALNNPRIARTEPGKELIKSPPVIRVVEIVGIDEQMDGGTHVKNTKEIGELKMRAYENKGTFNKRIEVALS